MQLAKIKKTLLKKGLDEFSADDLLYALKTSQKKVAFVATIKTTNRINDIVSVCFQGRKTIKKLDFYLHQLCGYKWARNVEGVLVNGCQFNKIYDVLDSLSYQMGLTGEVKANFCRYFQL